MEIKIRRLTPDLLEDYLLFFDTHEDCYCVCYAATDQGGKDFSKQETRRSHAAEYVKNSLIQGYLAYVNDTVVGWCNANRKSDLLKSEGWSVMLSSVGITEADQNIKSVFCFTVAPNFRRKGISSMFLEQVCKDAADEGFYCVEAYPNKQFKDAFSDHMGPADLYKYCVYTITSKAKFQITAYNKSSKYTKEQAMFDAHISTLLSGNLFRKIINNDPLSLIEFNVLTGILMNNNIPFDTAFAAGTRKNPPSLQLTIHINPSTTLVLVTNLEAGSSVFSPSP